jgi:hypothetical protein
LGISTSDSDDSWPAAYFEPTTASPVFKTTAAAKAANTLSASESFTFALEKQ